MFYKSNDFLSLKLTQLYTPDLFNKESYTSKVQKVHEWKQSSPYCEIPRKEIM